MAFLPPCISAAVTFHQPGGHGSPCIDAPATVTAVLQPGGSQVKLSGNGFSSDCVEHISFVGDPATSSYWTYGDDRDGLPGGDVEL
jgi:hypothetical protein